MYKVYVGCLPASCTVSQLREFFSRFGEISQVKLGKRAGNRFCSGVGGFSCLNKYVFEQILAIREFSFHGRLIYCDRLLSGEDLLLKNQELGAKRVFISNLPQEATDSDIETAMSTFGAVQNGYRIKTLKNQIRPYGFVSFFEMTAAIKAIHAGQIQILGQLVFITPFKRKEQNQQKFSPQTTINSRSIQSNRCIVKPSGQRTANTNQHQYSYPQVSETTETREGGQLGPSCLKPTSSIYHKRRSGLRYSSRDLRINVSIRPRGPLGLTTHRNSDQVGIPPERIFTTI